MTGKRLFTRSSIFVQDGLAANVCLLGIYMIKLSKSIVCLSDMFLFPIVCPAALLLKSIRAIGIHRLPLCKKTLFKIGVFPIRKHYYEPLFDMQHIKRPFSENRVLPGINWNVEEQLSLLDRFQYSNELSNVPTEKTDDLIFYLNNGAFESGDAEYWYNLIRLKKPNRIIEVGGGNSTLIAIKAIKKNEEEIPGYKCKHICIEPYEMRWLERTGVTIIRKKIENVDKVLFSELAEDDILFIDSSHIIRPQGDVLFEYLELLPSLNKGVIVHIHDIFSPKDYRDDWIRREVKFWNEQYLLEAFLTSNRNWKIIGALNFLHHNHFEDLRKRCIFLTPDREPGSFYIQKIA